jgi:hypothetical protein
MVNVKVVRYRTVDLLPRPAMRPQDATVDGNDAVALVIHRRPEPALIRSSRYIA